MRFLISRKPGSKEKDCGDFCEFRWLKGNRTVTHPAARSIDAHPDVRNIAKRQSGQCQREPNPPRFLPEMIVHQRSKNARDQSNPDPNRLAFDEEIDVSMAVARVCARAEKHHDPDDKQ